MCKDTWWECEEKKPQGACSVGRRPRKHVELIKAWADGASIQFWNRGSKSWMDVAYDIPSWSDEDQYRIKPEPKPAIEVIQGQGTFMGWVLHYNEEETKQYNKQRVKWTIDCETGRIKSVELLDK